jgi:hypothetical protein
MSQFSKRTPTKWAIRKFVALATAGPLDCENPAVDLQGKVIQSLH